VDTVAAHLARAAAALAAVTDTPRLDAEILLAHALGITRAQLLARTRDLLSPEGLSLVDRPTPAQPAALDRACVTPLSRFDAFIARRAQGEPIAYITGRWEFFSLAFAIRPPILVPRPETEHLVEIALAHLESRRGPVLDLCTGSGCVAVAVAKNAPNCPVAATDINPAAAVLAHENAKRHQANVAVAVMNLAEALAAAGPAFEVIVANPPYVETGAWAGLSRTIRDYEDPRALLAGDDGLDTIRRILATAPRILRPAGLLALEVGEGQAESVQDLFANAGFTTIDTRRDLQGIARIVHGCLR